MTTDANPTPALTFRSARAKYSVFNFHRKENQERMAAWLSRDSKRSILLLSGPAKLGKTYLVEAAGWQLREAFQVGIVDLRGYETSSGSLADYLHHGMRIAQGLSPAPAHGGYGTSLSLEIKASSIFAVAGVSIGLSLKVPLEDIRSFFAPGVDLPGPPLDDKTQLALFLAALTRNKKLVLIVKQAELATDALVTWLVFQCNVNPGLRLVFCSTVTPDALPAIRPYRPEIIRVEPLSRAETRAVVEDGFGLKDTPAWIEDHLWNTAHGCPGAIAAVMLQLLQADLLIGQENSWQLDTSSEERLASIFATQLAEDIGSLISTAPQELQEALRNCLIAAAMANGVLPLMSALQALGTLTLRAQLEDYLDEAIASDERSVPFTDARLLVPGFPGEPVYFLRDPLTLSLLRLYSTDDHREWIATRLWSTLSADLGSSRLRTHVLLGLAQWAKPELVSTLADRLSWWIRFDEVHQLAERLARELHAGHVAVEVLWRAAMDVEAPPERRLALLHACEMSGNLLPALMGDLWLVKGLLLGRLQAFADAKHSLESALQPLREVHGPKSIPVARCLRELAQLYTYQFVTDAAVGCIDEAVRLYEEVDPSYSGLGEALNTRAFVYSLTTRIQNYDIALDAHHRAYEILTKEGGEASFFAAQHLRSIGDISMMFERLEEAVEYYERAAPLLEATCASSPHFVESCYSNLSFVYSKMGLLDRASSALAKAAQFAGAEAPAGDNAQAEPHTSP